MTENSSPNTVGDSAFLEGGNPAQPLTFTAGQSATLACQLEVTAAKPGNVHRAADFEDVTLIDFLSSAVAIGSAIDAQAAQMGTGELILSAVQATRHIAGTNTNLGMILLICPLAKLVQQKRTLDPSNVTSIVDSIEGTQTQAVYRAIQLAQPGGMNASGSTAQSRTVEQWDVTQAHDASQMPAVLIDAMALSAHRDMIARQYCCGFATIFEFVLPAIVEGQKRFGKLSLAIVFAHVKTMARFPDSLIGRKLGDGAAQKSAALAGDCLRKLSDQDHESFWRSVGDLDFWLRSDGHRRNPGTTADLIATALYVGIRQNTIRPPFN